MNKLTSCLFAVLSLMFLPLLGVKASPVDTVAPYFWFVGDQIAGLSANDSVPDWIDTSGNGHNATQSVASSRMRYAPNAVNGHAAVSADGVQQFFEANSIAALINSGVWTIAIVLKGNSPSSGAIPWSAGVAFGFGPFVLPAAFPSQWQFYRQDDAFNGQLLDTGVSPTSVAPQLLVLRANGGSFDGRINGVSVGSTTSTWDAVTCDDFLIGKSSSLFGLPLWKGLIPEFVGWGEFIANTTLGPIEDELMEKYGIAGG